MSLTQVQQQQQQIAFATIGSRHVLFSQPVRGELTSRAAYLIASPSTPYHGAVGDIAAYSIDLII